MYPGSRSITVVDLYSRYRSLYDHSCVYKAAANGRLCSVDCISLDLVWANLSPKGCFVWIYICNRLSFARVFLPSTTIHGDVQGQSMWVVVLGYLLVGPCSTHEDTHIDISSSKLISLTQLPHSNSPPLVDWVHPIWGTPRMTRNRG
jgi:hypothetical protein